MDEQQIYFNRIKVQHLLFTDVFRRFFHLLFKNSENKLTSFVLKGFFKSSDDLGVELVNAAIEAVQARCELSDSKLKKLIDVMSETVVDYFEARSTEEQIMNSDAIRHPEVVIPLISQLCGVLSDSLSSDDVEKCDLSGFDQTYQLGDFANNVIPIFANVPMAPEGGVAAVPPRGPMPV